VLSERLAIQIRIGLAASEKRPLGALSRRARTLGLTRAEVELASQGRSFDVRDSAAIALALAYREGAVARIGLLRSKAMAAGLSEDGVVVIQQLVDKERGVS
jgi:hypothetical protein